VISEEFAFFGFDETSWDRLVSLFLRDQGPGVPRGVLVVVANAAGMPVASFHTARGSLDPAALASLDDLEALCGATACGACIVMRDRARIHVEDHLAEPLDAEQDFVARVMRFARVLRELGDGNWVRVWPNPLPDLLLSAAPAAQPAVDLLLPDGHNAILGVFDQGELWTGAVLRRSGGHLDLFAGPDAISQWAGPLGGEWRRDHRVLVHAVERELGPLQLGLFMELPTARRLFRRREAGDWAMAYATRELLVHPLPGFLAAGLGLDGLGGVARYAFQALEQMDPEEIVTIARGFWRGLTDGKGLEGLLGFSPGGVVAAALKRARSDAQSDDPPSPPQDEPDSGQAPPTGGSRSDPII
jgi:hypothetical protein